MVSVLVTNPIGGCIEGAVDEVTESAKFQSWPSPTCGSDMKIQMLEKVSLQVRHSDGFELSNTQVKSSHGVKCIDWATFFHSKLYMWMDDYLPNEDIQTETVSWKKRNVSQYIQ